MTLLLIHGVIHAHHGKTLMKVQDHLVVKVRMILMTSVLQHSAALVKKVLNLLVVTKRLTVTQSVL
jgi:hypothetical protein